VRRAGDDINEIGACNTNVYTLNADLSLTIDVSEIHPNALRSHSIVKATVGAAAVLSTPTTRYTVLSTDYTSSAVVYSCTSIFNGAFSD
jgi:hypothetical protein